MLLCKVLATRLHEVLNDSMMVIYYIYIYIYRDANKGWFTDSKLNEVQKDYRPMLTLTLLIMVIQVILEGGYSIFFIMENNIFPN